MNRLRQQSAQTLSEWLAIATQDLVPSAQARVRPEIEAHYAEAVQANRVNGLSEMEAAGAALADLGDVRTAARRFRRKYLTRQEIQLDPMLFKHQQNAKVINQDPNLVLPGLLILCNVGLVYITLTSSMPSRIPDMFWGTMAVWFILPYCTFHMESARTNLRWILVCRMVYILTLILFALSTICLSGWNVVGDFSLTLCICLLSYALVTPFFTLLKLHAVRDDDLPPPGNITAA